MLLITFVCNRNLEFVLSKYDNVVNCLERKDFRNRLRDNLYVKIIDKVFKEDIIKTFKDLNENLIILI